MYHQEKEETDAPPSKLKMVKVESVCAAVLAVARARLSLVL